MKQVSSKLGEFLPSVYPHLPLPKYLIESDFLSAMARVVGEQQFLSATITSYSAVNNLVRRVARTVAVGVIGFCVMLVWEIGDVLSFEQQHLHQSLKLKNIFQDLTFARTILTPPRCDQLPSDTGNAVTGPVIRFRIYGVVPPSARKRRMSMGMPGEWHFLGMKCNTHTHRHAELGMPGGLPRGKSWHARGHASLACPRACPPDL